MKRRGLLVGGVAAGAGALGVGAALWRSPSAAERALWAMAFERPGGGQLALDTFRGRPLLLNFWATWCPPCVTEMPLLDRFQREQPADGWQVIGLAVDQLAPVVTFLSQHPVSFAIGMAGLDGIEVAHSLGNASGSLPFTVAFGRTGKAVQRKLGVVTTPDLAAWAGQLR
jgi:thiol-disulfide isomerase/thioredoxin